MKALHIAIKTCAKLFAALLIAGIIFSIFSIIADISYFTSSPTEYVCEKSISPEGISALDVDLCNAELIIQNGDILHAETNSKEITLLTDGKTLKIREPATHKGQKGTKVIITLPSLSILSEANINIDAGRLTADELSAVKFSLDVGAGNMEINKLNVYSRAKITGGAGRITVKDGSISNLDLEIGAGDAEIFAAVFGESEIECGVGNLELTLVDGENLNRIDCDTGIGRFTVDGEKIHGERIINHGANSIEINGGIGKVNIIFADQNKETE